MFTIRKSVYGSSIIFLVIIMLCMISACFLSYSLGYMAATKKINELENQIQKIQGELANLQTILGSGIQNSTYYTMAVKRLPQLYEQVRKSVVTVKGIMVQHDFFATHYMWVQGSGFVYNFTGQMVIVTNHHVVNDAINITVTFADGNSYPAHVLGSDPYADLAVLSSDAPPNEYHPLEVINSSTLKVGDTVVVVGSPFGLAGSMSIGVISALGRTITEEETRGYPIANVIQTTAPLNPGNSGGPLLNLNGQVVGITTAIVSGSQGISFAIPSNTILREVGDLVTRHMYDKHPWLGVVGVDMTYEIAKAMGTNITYGWLIVQVISGGPADKAGLREGTKTVSIAGEQITIGGDIIIALNGEKITGIDDLSSYLEEHTLPDQTINVTIVRDNTVMTLQVTLGKRPPPS